MLAASSGWRDGARRSAGNTASGSHHNQHRDGARGQEAAALPATSLHPLVGSIIILPISLLHHPLTPGRVRASGFSLCITRAMERSNQTSLPGKPARFSVPQHHPGSLSTTYTTHWGGPSIPCSSGSLLSNALPKAITSMSWSQPVQAAALGGSRRRKGGSLIVLSKGKRDSPMNSSARQRRKHLQPPRCRLHLPMESRGHLHTAQVPPSAAAAAQTAASCKDLMHFTFNCRSERIPRLLPCRETPRC